MNSLARGRLFFFAVALILVPNDGRGQAPDGSPGGSTNDASGRARIDALEQKLEELGQQVSALQPEKAPATRASSGASVTADSSGFSIRSEDGDYVFRIGADIQVDNRSFFGRALTPLPDGIVLRRARPVFSGTLYKYFNYYFRPDFGLGSTIIYDAYIQISYFQRFKLRAGKFKPPVGLERLQEDDNTSFVERGLPTLLVPSRDIGFQLSGDVIDRRLAYAAGLFNGVSDNGLSDAAASDHRDIAARLFLTPFAPDEKNILRGLGFGVGATTGSVDGIALPSYKTFSQNNFITFASGVASDGHRDRITPGAYYYLGPLGLFSEYGLSKEGFQTSAGRHDIAFRSWQAQATYLLTGERKAFGNLAPRRNFDPRNHAWGALEIAARTGEFSADRGLYNYGFAAEATSARIAREWVGGVNWYLNRIVRFSVDYGVTHFEGGAPVGNRPSEQSLITRFQMNYQSFAQ